ncbi:drug resistance transporter, Bcr/CflA subfamily [Longilinea arvoryzae]|uniref:Drug resistance transporter, Bcr/CflA subfamily n=1 Tax=Longilinea arvoryzae TaxID=360412 RepID=A0A0K8MXG0_9CHLR|nr:Bcr/CflA family efflux MFS transporter [Longilinea arvoryzae]GAP15934.1 drug resistance transporter, Bcr/CflA subfamily [Longilinea arvoryzae]
MGRQILIRISQQAASISHLIDDDRISTLPRVDIGSTLTFTMEHALTVEQKSLKVPGVIFLITVLNMTAPLSTDMYMPSIPTMMAFFDTSASILNLALVGFFFFFAVGMLVFGPLSDKYGRRPVLLSGLAIYTLFSALCALSTSVWQLISFRVIEGLGAGCMVSVSTALVKDCFDVKTRGTILAIIQSMSIIAPMVAPIIGAFIARYTSWRVTFWVLFGISTTCLLVTLLLQETLPPQARYHGKPFGSIGRLIAVGKNKSFSFFLLVVAMIPTAFMAYIAVSSYIYIDFFALSETTYSLYFAINSAVLILGPILYIRANRSMATRKVVPALFTLAAVSGAAILLLGRISPLAFLLSFAPLSFCSSSIRPLSTNILLNQQDSDTGSASSLINFGNTALGSLGMVLGTLPWSNFVTGLGTIVLTCALLGLAGWILFTKSGLRLKGV